MKKNQISRRTVLALLGALPAVAQTSIGHGDQVPEPLRPSPAPPMGHPGVNFHDLFAISGDRLITDEEHFGILNGHLSVGVNYRDVAELSGLFAPPYASSDFSARSRFRSR